MADAILPSGAGTPPPRWSSDHLRLHRSLLRQPQLLPRGATLLLAVSGGQDSMAMTGLLRDLQPLHQWRLHLWHGDHGWRPDSASQAEALRAWARNLELPITLERQQDERQRGEQGQAEAAAGNREADARSWRYGCLQRQALRLDCRHVLTAHTATDRAETVLLHLARGSHRRGLASLRRRQSLAALLAGSSLPPAEAADGDGPQAPPGTHQAAGDTTPSGPAQAAAASDGTRPPTGSRQPATTQPLLWLVRPLQIFCRQDTARLCRREGWPVWPDPTNDQLELSRNRIRARVLPVLEELHPGACRRISDQAERLAAEQEQQQELLDLALIPLRIDRLALDRRALLQLSPAGQALLLQHWLRLTHGRELESRGLAALLPRLALERGAGRLDLAGGWQLRWKGTTLSLLPSHPPQHGHG